MKIFLLACASACVLANVNGQYSDGSLDGLTEEERLLVEQLRQQKENEAKPEKGTELRPTAEGLRIRVGRDQDVVHERTIRQETSVFQTAADIAAMEKNVLTKATETFASLAVDSIGTTVASAMEQVKPHIARVDSVVDGLAELQAQSDGLVAEVDKKIEAADDKTATALEEADAATKKLLEEAAAAQEKLLEKVQDDLKAGTDAMDETFSTIDADADDKKCDDDAAGAVRLFEAKTFQFCDGKKWVEVSGGGDAYGSRAEPWGKHCNDILVKKKKEGLKTLPDGVYWINGAEDPGPFRVYCDMTTDGGGWTLLLTWRNTFNNARHFFRAPIQNGFSEVLDPTQTPQVGPEEHATDSHHHNEPMAAGLSWKQRRDLWESDNTEKDYRWDSYRYDGGLHFAMKGRNTHSSNLLYAVARGLNHNEIGRGFSNSRIDDNYEVIKKKYASNLQKGAKYGVWSLGHYDCDCSEGYYLNGNWGDQSSMWVIFTDNVQDGERGSGGPWTNPNHSNHAACWMR